MCPFGLLSQQVLRDDELLDFAGAVEDAECAHVAIQALDRGALHDAHATEHLQRLIDDFLRRL